MKILMSNSQRQMIDLPSVTAGVYKARELIHRRMTDRRLLAIPVLDLCLQFYFCN